MSGEGARYSQIVGELKAQIDAGELAAGDRVPSTREIVRRWGVAMATATKVLTELKHQGLVRAVPGVGTVVDTRPQPDRPARTAPSVQRRTPSSPDGALTSERITSAAVAVADAEGLAAVSMRRVATEIGVATMSLYRHVTDKDDLLARMMDAAFVEMSIPQRPPPGWRAQLELAARMMWGQFRRHPWLAPAVSMTRPQPLAGAVPFSEWLLTALSETGLDLQAKFTAYLTLFNFVRGIAVNLESEQEAEALTGIDNEEWMDEQEPTLLQLIGTGRFPQFEQLVTGGYDFDLDGLFEFGLQRLLDGLAALID